MLNSAPLRHFLPVLRKKEHLRCKCSFLWEDYKIDFFAFLGVVFVPLRKILNFQS